MGLSGAKTVAFSEESDSCLPVACRRVGVAFCFRVVTQLLAVLNFQSRKHRKEK